MGGRKERRKDGRKGGVEGKGWREAEEGRKKEEEEGRVSIRQYETADSKKRKCSGWEDTSQELRVVKSVNRLEFI